MSNRWDETWHRLREWTNGQARSERLAAQILLHEGYESVDPSHPLGGPDGGKDAICLRGGKKSLMAVYFPRGQQRFSAIKKKFLNDLRGVRANKAHALAFVTNQELSLSEREELTKAAKTVPIELFHLERVTMILDEAGMAGVRQQFLDIGEARETTFVLGGTGGNAPGAGGGGGGVIGSGWGGDGGPGGGLRLEGEPGKAPGAGGGGGGATGHDAAAGEGGGGAEVGWVLVPVEPGKSYDIQIGDGGHGGIAMQDGQKGGDTTFGGALTFKGGQGGRSGQQVPAVREVQAADIDGGFHVSVLVADFVQIRDNLLFIFGGGWERYSVPQFPWDMQWPVVLTASFGQVAVRTALELSVELKNPQGELATIERCVVTRDHAGLVARPHVLVSLRVTIPVPGIWTIRVVSGQLELATLPVEFCLASA